MLHQFKIMPYGGYAYMTFVGEGREEQEGVVGGMPHVIHHQPPSQWESWRNYSDVQNVASHNLRPHLITPTGR